jgi:hypothetical protein
MPSPKKPPKFAAETPSMTQRRADPRRATRKPSYGMARGSVGARHKATLAVRTITALGATSAVVGTGFLTAALVPAANVTAFQSTAPGASTAPVAPSAQPPASTPVPHSLLATKSHPPKRPASGTAAKAKRAHATKSAALAPTHPAPTTTAVPAHAATTRAVPTHTAPTRTAPMHTVAPPPQPVVTSGGS